MRNTRLTRSYYVPISTINTWTSGSPTSALTSKPLAWIYHRSYLHYPLFRQRWTGCKTNMTKMVNRLARSQYLKHSDSNPIQIRAIRTSLSSIEPKLLLSAGDEYVSTSRIQWSLDTYTHFSHVSLVKATFLLFQNFSQLFPRKALTWSLPDTSGRYIQAIPILSKWRCWGLAVPWKLPIMELMMYRMMISMQKWSSLNRFSVYFCALFLMRITYAC